MENHYFGTRTQDGTHDRGDRLSQATVFSRAADAVAKNKTVTKYLAQGSKYPLVGLFFAKGDSQVAVHISNNYAVAYICMIIFSVALRPFF